MTVLVTFAEAPPVTMMPPRKKPSAGSVAMMVCWAPSRVTPSGRTIDESVAQSDASVQVVPVFRNEQPSAASARSGNEQQQGDQPHAAHRRKDGVDSAVRQEKPTAETSDALMVASGSIKAIGVATTSLLTPSISPPRIVNRES